VYEPNVQELLARLDDRHLVLDVGGWACPFNRAQWVLDAGPYETRGFYRTFGGPPHQGGEREWFSRETWVQRDICDREPWPFEDGQFDFSICSHTLEDIRDPLWVCSELIRVSKAGYIEVPSRAFESCRDLERPGMVGLSHHRWLIDIEGDHVRYLPKMHLIHAERRFSLPASHCREMSPRDAVQWLWWEGDFAYEEVTLHGLEALEAELEGFVQRTRPYSPLRLALDRQGRKGRELAVRVARKAARLVKGSG
jgi:hypothetical protein